MQSGRVSFLDALRGIAAVAVVSHHYNERLHFRLFEFGNLGVAVFFVLSGFVIAMSIGRSEIHVGYVWRFVFRRAVRLDIPYWATIACVIVLGYALEERVKFDGVTVPQVLTHMFYLQDWFEFSPILPIFWTLCYEIQFYLALLFLTWSAQALGTRPYLVVVLTLVISLVDRQFGLTTSAFMGRFWFCFALGAMVYWSSQGELDRRITYTAVAAVLALGAATSDSYAVASSLTAAAISASLRFRPDFMSGVVWQFLGRISYSLYLTHLLPGWLALRFAEGFMHVHLALAVGTFVALGSAWVFYKLVESPAIALSRRVSVK